MHIQSELFHVFSSVGTSWLFLSFGGFVCVCSVFGFVGLVWFFFINPGLAVGDRTFTERCNLRVTENTFHN